MEQLTVAGHPDPVPASPVAVKLLEERLATTREKRGEEAAARLEGLVGKRIGTLLEGGMPSIDLATMRSIVDYVEIPAEDDPEPATGLGRMVRDLREKASQRGYGSIG